MYDLKHHDLQHQELPHPHQHDKMHPRPPGSLPLAQAYIPMQPWGKVYSPEEGTRKGTIFPDLYRPYESRWHHG